MSDQVRCHKGKCEEKEKNFLDECIDCNEVEEIEHELLNIKISAIINSWFNFAFLIFLLNNSLFTPVLHDLGPINVYFII